MLLLACLLDVGIWGSSFADNVLGRLPEGMIWAWFGECLPNFRHWWFSEGRSISENRFILAALCFWVWKRASIHSVYWNKITKVLTLLCHVSCSLQCRGCGFCLPAYEMFFYAMFLHRCSDVLCHYYWDVACCFCWSTATWAVAYWESSAEWMFTRLSWKPVSYYKFKLQKNFEAEHLCPELHLLMKSQEIGRCMGRGDRYFIWMELIFKVKDIRRDGKFWGEYVMDICHLGQSKSAPKSISLVTAMHGGKSFSSMQQLICL